MNPAERRHAVEGRLKGYELLALIGAGGMGEVYRARDTKLGREVALKLLPAEVAGDPDLVRRLDREARLLASLNHPGIAVLYGLEESDGQRFLVMELVSGQTLAERLRGRPLPTREALDVCREIADALETAHEAGIVHRDLKPTNVMVTPEGRVKLLDFGLAKVIDRRGDRLSGAADGAEDSTREGTVLGTAPYMSPEQARGQPVDRRTDIWAFGCCLYECLAGRRAFGGSTTSDTLAAVLEREPDWSALPGDIPLGVRQLMRRCLAKNVRKRLQHIGDARLDLEDATAVSEESSTLTRKPLGTPLLVATSALLLALGAALGSGLGGRRTTATPAQPATRLTLKLEGDEPGLPHLSVDRFFMPLALSPDGERLVFHARGASGSQLFLRELSGFETRALPGTEAATTPFFSPDGKWIGFWRAQDRILCKVSIAGGVAIEIGATDVPQRALWGPSDEILFESGYPNKELWSIPAQGGKAQPIAIRDRSAGEVISLRGRIPGSRDLLVASIRHGETWLAVLSRETGTRRRLLLGGRNVVAAYAPTGHLVYSDADTLFAVAVDPQRLEPVGTPVPVIHGIDHYFQRTNLVLSEAGTGTAVYVPAGRPHEDELVWVDLSGNPTPVSGARGPWPWSAVSLSPTGNEAAIELVDGTKLQVWIFDLERGTRRLLLPTGESRGPIWSHDGAFVTYVSRHGGAESFYRKRADGTGNEERLVDALSEWPAPEDWSPDGRSLLFTENTIRGDTDVWLYSGGAPSPLIASPFNDANARFSPDGRFVAFDADDGGVNRVYVQPFPGPGPRTTVSIVEGRFPLWARDGRQLFYQSQDQMMVVPVETEPVLKVGRPRPLFMMNRRRGFQVSPDSRRFLALAPTQTGPGPTELRVVLNWFGELEHLAPHPQR